MKGIKGKTNLTTVLGIASDIERIGYLEYLFTVAQALMQLSESADDMNKRKESERWESRSVNIDEVVANDVLRYG